MDKRLKLNNKQKQAFRELQNAVAKCQAANIHFIFDEDDQGLLGVNGDNIEYLCDEYLCDEVTSTSEMPCVSTDALLYAGEVNSGVGVSYKK